MGFPYEQAILGRMSELSVAGFETISVPSPLVEKTAVSQSTDSSNSFQQLLSFALLSSLNTPTGEAGDITGLITPLMLLLEQVRAQQTTQQPVETATEIGTMPWPVEGRVSQEFHDHHCGIDFAIPVGTPIMTSMSGKVTYAGWDDRGYGNLVIVEHGNYKTYYAHLEEIPVEVGQIVTRGQVIGYSGNTGNSSGPHLHYEIRINNIPVDPRSMHPEL